MQRPAVAITVLGFALLSWRGWSALQILGACALTGVVVGVVLAAA